MRAFLAMAALLLGGVHAGELGGPAPSRGDSAHPWVLTPEEARKLGFAIKARKPATPTKWEAEKFGLAAKWRTDLKSTFPSHFGRNSFYRFTLEEEIYPDPAKARIRLDSLGVLPPGEDREIHKAFPLRRGVLAGDKVIVVTTDVAGYMGKLKELAAAISLLAAAPDSVRRNQLLDSLGPSLQAKKSKTP